MGARGSPVHGGDREGGQPEKGRGWRGHVAVAAAEEGMALTAAAAAWIRALHVRAQHMMQHTTAPARHSPTQQRQDYVHGPGTSSHY